MLIGQSYFCFCCIIADSGMHNGSIGRSCSSYYQHLTFLCDLIIHDLDFNVFFFSINLSIDLRLILIDFYRGFKLLEMPRIQMGPIYFKKGNGANLFIYFYLSCIRLAPELYLIFPSLRQSRITTRWNVMSYSIALTNITPETKFIKKHLILH